MLDESSACVLMFVTHNSKPLIREKDCFSFLYSLSYVSLLPKYVMSKEVIIEIGKGKVV